VANRAVMREALETVQKIRELVGFPGLQSQLDDRDLLVRRLRIKMKADEAAMKGVEWLRGRVAELEDLNGVAEGTIHLQAERITELEESAVELAAGLAADDVQIGELKQEVHDRGVTIGAHSDRIMRLVQLLAEAEDRIEVLSARVPKKGK